MGAGRQFVRSAAVALLRATLVLGFIACSDDPTSGTTPFAIEASYAAAPDITVGARVTPSPTFVVRNSRGDALANVAVTVTITSGNGTLINAPLRSTAGSTSIGEWTIDTIAGANEVTITAGSAPAQKITINGIAGEPTSIAADAGQLNGFAGDFLSSLLVLRVKDRYGNSVSGMPIALSVGQGGGDVSPATLTTDTQGAATGINWRLGRLGGAQQLVATSGNLRAEIGAVIRSEFDPALRFSGTPLPEELAIALNVAIDRLHAGIIGDVPDVPVLNLDMSRCGIQNAVLNETVDDLVIFAVVTPIDGVGRVLASAGPCILRTNSRFPVIGVMRFDSDDVPALAANGRLASVALHEMLHVIGIGTLWRTRDMLFGSGTSDPRFIGALAGVQCIAAGGFSSCGDGRVPVENVGGSGTAESHWRESVFDREVMTGFVESNNDMPLSAITFASLQDLGYSINLLSADPFLLPAAGSVSPRLTQQQLAPWETTLPPVFEITASGAVRLIQIR